ncbi:MAG: hypothetical protein B6U89_06520 [Desulfurococcales archaeon ex4484_58]|nr:MAG: hypothetical protein B6U89_06520 [Desulfurococcales archaeon ex4484_58]
MALYEEDIVTKIRNILSDMRIELSRYVTHIKVEGQDIVIMKAIEWLKSVQHPGGYWGYRSVADTGLAILALATLGIKDEKWEIRLETGEKFEGGVSKAVNWIKSKCTEYNCEGNIWDTAIVVRALLELGIKDEWVFKSINWIYENTIENYKHEKPHHVAQAIIALARYGDLKRARELTNKLKEILINIELKDCYVLGQVIEAFVATGLDPFSPEIDKYVRYIENELRESVKTGISETTFQETVVGLMGLIKSHRVHLEDDVIQMLIAEILKYPERRKPDGSWYHDAKKTALALLALNALGHMPRVEVHPRILYETIGKYEKKIISVLREYDENTARKIREIKKGYLFTALGISASILAIILLITHLLPNPTIENFIVETILSSLSVSAFKKVHELTRI